MEISKSEGSWLKIGEVARSLDIAVETIRMYEREGILIPGKTETGQRIFNENDVHWLSCIRKLIKEQGLNIEGIRRLLALMPCWDLKPCTKADRDECPAYLKSIKPCWMIKAETKGNCITDSCRHCNVYQSASECTSLKNLLYQFKATQEKVESTQRESNG